MVLGDEGWEISRFSEMQAVGDKNLVQFSILQTVLCDIISCVFIDLVSEVKLLNNHGVKNYRKPADQRAIHCLKSSLSEEKGVENGVSS